VGILDIGHARECGRLSNVSRLVFGLDTLRSIAMVCFSTNNVFGWEERRRE
jgi:hypothetical protein